MKKIIQHGIQYYKIKCYKCGCIFTFNNDDISSHYSTFHENYYMSINCPDCGAQLTTWDKDEWAIYYNNEEEL